MAHNAALMRNSLPGTGFIFLAALAMGIHAHAQTDKMNGMTVLPAEAVNPSPPPVVYLTADSLDDKRKLSIGDHVSYRVLEDKNPAVDLMVTDAGDLELPLLGRVAAVGRHAASWLTI